MRLATRILLGMLLPVALLVVSGGYQLYLVRQLQLEIRELVDVQLQARRDVLSLEASLAELGRLSQIFFTRGDEDYVADLRSRREEITERVRSLRQIDLSRGALARLYRLEASWEEYSGVASATEELFLEQQSLPFAQRVPVAQRIELDELFAATEAKLPDLDSAIQQAVEAQLRTSTEHADQGVRISLVTAIASFSLALLIAVLIAGNLSRGLWRLAAGTREIAAGNFEFRVDEKGGFELSELARDFNWMAARLSELDRLKRDFVASVSHDLKAPLASMQETTRLLLEGSPGRLNDRQRRLLDLNLQCNDRLSFMIADLLDLARLETGGLAFERRRTDLRQLVEQAVAEVSPLGSRAGIEIEIETSVEPVWVEVDHAWILRAAWNLLSNAVRHSPARGRIDTSTEVAVDREALQRLHPGAPPEVTTPAALLAVRDHGPGIPEEERDVVFERFYRARNARREGGGTGLGLAISREVVQRHGGEVWVEAAPGGGSLFVISLPALAETTVPADGDPS